MKVILYMAITANGLIAKKNHDVPWTDEEWEEYKRKAREVGCMIIGKTTYKLFEKDDFEDLGNPLVIVLTSKPLVERDKLVAAKSITDALSKIKEHGFKSTLVCGGSKTNKSFLDSKLIDEIYLDVEPFILGDGISLFESTNTELNLKLLSSKKYGTNSIQLHYEVKK